MKEMTAIRQRNLQLAQQPDKAITENALNSLISNEKGRRADPTKKCSWTGERVGTACSMKLEILYVVVNFAVCLLYM
jgi:hypothetical protein